MILEIKINIKRDEQMISDKYRLKKYLDRQITRQINREVERQI